MKPRDTNISRHYQQTWYEKQKACNNGYEGYVYAIITDKDETYVGSTTNSLKKRLWQHKSGTKKATTGKAIVDIIELEAVVIGGDLKGAEQIWIDLIRPSLNYSHARAPDKVPRRSTLRVTANGKRYNSLIHAWREVGKVPLGTMKSRRFRGHPIEACLGLVEPLRGVKKVQPIPTYPRWYGSLLSPLEMVWYYGLDHMGDSEPLLQV